MSAKTVWISHSKYNNMPKELRTNIRKALGSKKEVCQRYVGNVENNLRIRGENSLANELLSWFSVPIDEDEALLMYQN